MTSMLVIPQALAATNDGLFYRPSTGDRFYYEFNLMDYGQVYAEDEIFYIEVDDASVPIPDPITHLNELSNLALSFYFENGTTFGSFVMAFMPLPDFEYPVGNWSLITNLAATDIEPLLSYGTDDLTFVQYDDYLGYSWSNTTGEIQIILTVDYSKFDGLLHDYNFEAWNTTSSSLLSQWTASRFSYHNLRWGFEEGDRFTYHIITAGSQAGLDIVDENMYLEVADEGMTAIPWDCSSLMEIPNIGYALNWMNDTTVVDPYLVYTLKTAVPIGNWSLLDSFIADLSGTIEEIAVDGPDPYFWGFSFEMTLGEMLLEAHVDYFKLDGLVARHSITTTNTTSSEQLASITIERINLEPYTDRIAPAVNSPDDVTFVFGTTDHNITWTLSDENPTTYQVLVNGSVEASGSWTDDTDIVLDLDDFGAGVYNCTIVVYDIAGNHVMDTVIVTVTAPGVGGTGNLLMDNILYIAIGVGAIVVIGAVVCMRRKS